MPAYHALDVGQGDATFIELPDSTRLLIDAGVDGNVLREVREILGSDRYIDIGIITHLQKDHFYGFVPLLKQYRFGVILWNGRVDAADKKDWDAIKSEAAAQHIPMLAVGRGDSIRSHSERTDILSPGPEYRESFEPNDTSVVSHIRTTTWSALITGDIDAVLEHDLGRRFGPVLRSDILKVPHHGSAYSSTSEFIEAVAPEVAIISVGLHNTYHHPSKDTMQRYLAEGAQVFRTDLDGMVTVKKSAGRMEVATSSKP